MNYTKQDYLRVLSMMVDKGLVVLVEENGRPAIKLTELGRRMVRHVEASLRNEGGDDIESGSFRSTH